MAAVPIPAGTHIVSTTTFLYGRSECQHKLYFRTRTLFADMITICAYIMTDVYELGFMMHMVSSCQLISVECALVGEEIFSSATLFPHDPRYGAIPELGTAPIVASVWQLRTGTAGRRGRGRIFTFALPVNYVENYYKLSDYAYLQQRALADRFESRYGVTGAGTVLLAGVFSRKAFEATHDVVDAFAPLRLVNVVGRLTSRSSRRS